MTRKMLFVQYCAKDFLDGVQVLDIWEELAYRRVIDLIYATNDRLEDNDHKLAWQTKVGSRWKKIKQKLVRMGKISLDQGFIRNDRCTKTIQKTLKNLEQKSGAGKRSAELRKQLKHNKTPVTAVPTANTTVDPTNRKPKTTEEDDGYCRARAWPTAVEILKIVGADPEDPKWFGTASRVEMWLKAGWSPEDLIYPALKKMMLGRSGQGPPGTSAYLEKVIANYQAKLNEPMATADESPRQSRPVRPKKPTPADVVRDLYDRNPGAAARLAPGLPAAGGLIIDNDAEGDRRGGTADDPADRR